MSKRENFYRRNPGDALSGMVGMSLEERGVYNTVIDLIYLTWRPLEDNRQYIAAHCGCAVQKVNPIIDRLVARGKLLRFQEDGCWYISNRRFEDERCEVKGPAKTRSGRGKVEEKSAGVEEKSREVEEKSEGVGEKSGLFGGDNEEKQRDKPLDRQDRQERQDKNPPEPPRGGRRKPSVSIPEGFPDAEALADAERRVAERQSSVKVEYQAVRFRNWAIGRDAKYADWRATWRNWIERCIEDSALPKQADKSAEWTESRWRAAVRIFTAESLWDEAVAGPKPGETGCRVPPAIQREFSIEPAEPQPVARTA